MRIRANYRSMGKACGRGLLLVSLMTIGVGCGRFRGSAEADKPAEDPELKWARATAEHFMNAAVAKSSKKAEGLLTKAFQERAKGEPFPNIKFLYKKWEITSAELGPSGLEAVFKGTVARDNSPFADIKATFSLMLIKESGQWKVDSYTCSE